MRCVRAVVFAIAVLAASLSSTPIALGAQAEPLPSEAPASVFSDAEEDAPEGRPWWRLVILIPAAALVGAGTVAVRRIARERGMAGTS
jgi:hypothetical protein